MGIKLKWILLKAIRANWTLCHQLQDFSRREDRCMRNKKTMKERKRNPNRLSLSSERRKRNWDKKIWRFKSQWSSFRYSYKITKRKSKRLPKRLHWKRNLPRKKKLKLRWRESSMFSLIKKQGELNQRKKQLWNMKIFLIELGQPTLTSFQRYQISSIGTIFWFKKMLNLTRHTKSWRQSIKKWKIIQISI